MIQTIIRNTLIDNVLSPSMGFFKISKMPDISILSKYSYFKQIFLKSIKHNLLQ